MTDPNQSKPSRWSGTVGRIRAFLNRELRLRHVLALGLLAVLLYIPSLLGRGDAGGNNPDDPQKLGITELIRNVKSELEDLETQRLENNEKPLFQVESFDLEINFVIRASSRTSAGVRYQVVTADTERQFGRETVQKITLHMTATPPDDRASPAASGSIDSEPDEVIDDAPPTLSDGG